MVGRYAVHCSNVAFLQETWRPRPPALPIQSSASTVDRIRQEFAGGSVANELIEFSILDDRWAFKAEGAGDQCKLQHQRKTTLLLFINHRCVESTNIRKAVEQTYAALPPEKADIPSSTSASRSTHRESMSTFIPPNGR